ncbi:hypothetical protein F1188_20000 [Roseospira marina]|uniref:Uncharacterized protein n=1 Tax=Roseospira marina TaxID=140057 RepID=A0A5M6I4T0_9PROT|nr:hypothetical protein [Roseospira marina]KAA5603230.1 hypothetical protein F1188_20000 [Roseospira marina]MBB4316195.1 hypothetical protein [Roseospira marina]
MIRPVGQGRFLLTQASALVRVAMALPALPMAAIQIDVGKAVLAEAVAAGRDPTPAEWDLILTPAEEVAEGCAAGSQNVTEWRE